MRGGAAAIPQLRTDFTRATGRSDIEVVDLAEWLDRPVLQQTSFEARCLLGFAAAAFLAALFLVGQAVARSAAAAIAELQPLRAVGMSTAQSVAAAAAAPTIGCVLGGVLGVAAAVVASRWFAVGAVGHALITAVRRRRHDIAVLRALGMTRRQCRWIAVIQAVVLALVGLVVGVPLGVAVGRLIWHAVASYTPFQYDAPVALVALTLVGPAALLIVNLLSAWPGHRAARLPVAQLLRAE